MGKNGKKQEGDKLAALRAFAGGGNPLAGLSLEEIADLAWGQYRMSYGKLVAYVRDFGKLPPKT